jgi:tRNA A37 threonylcarbamoyladenosine modification protein TsaB
VNLAVDAQRGEFYLAVWEISGQRCVEISPLKIVSAAEIATRQAAGEICAGPEMKRSLFPSAARLASLASKCTNFVSGDQIKPVYLRETNFVKAVRGRVI